MPLKWKIYYLCSLYLLLSCTVFFCMLVYTAITTSSAAGEIIKSYIIAAAVLAALSFKSVLSIRAIGHFKNYTPHSKFERAAFIAGFCFTLIFGITGFVLCLTIMIPEDFTRHGDQQPLAFGDFSEMVIDFSLFATVLCCLFFAVFDLFLLKAIRKRYYNNLIVLGESIGQQLED